MAEPTHWKPYTPANIPTPALVTDVDLAAPTVGLTLDARYRAVRALVRVHGRPIGYADIIAAPGEVIDRERILAALDQEAAERAIGHLIDDLTAHGVAVHAVHPHLADILDQMAAAGGCLHPRRLGGPFVTVAICTRDRAARLGAVLASIAAQTYQDIEILVVDSAPSNDATEQMVRASHSRVRYVREQQPGLDRARNRAISEARGAIIAFIDDDATADPRWVEGLIAAFDAPEVMCVTGMVAPARLETAAQELFERFGHTKGFHRLRFSLREPPPATHCFPYKGYLGAGCNSAFRRTVFNKIGLFDPRFDMGTPICGGGDHDMFARILRAGHTLVYTPDAVVFHDHIAEMSALIIKLGQYQQAYMAYLTKAMLNDRGRAPALLVHTIWHYLLRTSQGLAAAIKQHDRPLALALSQAIGAWLGPLALYQAYRKIADDGSVVIPAPEPGPNLPPKPARPMR